MTITFGPQGYEPEGEALDPQVALYVMGCLDELAVLGIVDLAGDSPLEDREQRREYRRLKREGYKPELRQVFRVLRACMAEAATPELMRLFQAIVEEGWEAVKQERAAMKADEAQETFQLDDDRGFAPGPGGVWIPL